MRITKVWGHCVGLPLYFRLMNNILNMPPFIFVMHECIRCCQAQFIEMNSSSVANITFKFSNSVRTDSCYIGNTVKIYKILKFGYFKGVQSNRLCALKASKFNVKPPLQGTTNSSHSFTFPWYRMQNGNLRLIFSVCDLDFLW